MSECTEANLSIAPDDQCMRVAVVLPGLHRVCRGAEVALESVASELSAVPGVKVTLFGSGEARPSDRYKFVHVGNIPRENFEKFPRFPVFRNEYVWEEASFIPGLIARYRPADFDITLTCSFPFVNWMLLLQRNRHEHRPAHVYVTQNGDHVVHSRKSEYRWFSCDGLVCTNPDFFETNREQWPSRLIPNGVDPSKFFPGRADRIEFNLPEGVPIVLMVSALISSKRIAEGIRAAAMVPGFHLVICGDGPERTMIQELGDELIPGRFHLRTLPYASMPRIYRCSDVFLHMSLDEPSANAYIEALASGLPIVTHDRLVTRWTLEKTGILVNAKDPTAVANGLILAMSKKSPEEVSLRLKLVEERFSWSEIARQYYDFFREILAASHDLNTR